MKSENLINNNVLVDVLTRLMFCEDKPSRLNPTDLTVLVYLLLRRAIDHPVFDSHDTMARRINVERKAVMKSITRLDRMKWISAEYRGRGRTKAITVNHDSMPATQPIRAKITDGAKRLALRYQQALQSQGRRKFDKNWFARQLPSTQRILSACGDDEALAREMMGFAFLEPRFRKRARTSVYHMYMLWPKLKSAYEARLALNARATPASP